MTRVSLSRRNAERLAKGLPMEMVRGRVGWHAIGRSAPSLCSIHPAVHRRESVEGSILMAEAACRWWGPSLIHIPNEGSAGPGGRVRSAKLKAQGQRSGASDYFLAVPVAGSDGASGWPGLWLELKAADGKPSKKQIDFLIARKSAGYAAGIAYTGSGAIAAIDTYLKGGWPE